MIVLDTDALVYWLATPDRLSPAAAKRIDVAWERSEPLLVSALTVWKLAVMETRGRLSFTIPLTDWIEQAKRVPHLQFVPVDDAVALEAMRLPEEFHGNPVDRMIVALARVNHCALVSPDPRVQAYPHVQSIW